LKKALDGEPGFPSLDQTSFTEHKCQLPLNFAVVNFPTVH